MRLTEARLRVILSVSYWAVAFVVLGFFTSDDPFCARPGGSKSHDRNCSTRVRTSRI